MQSESKSAWPIPEAFVRLARKRKKSKGVPVTRTIMDALRYALRHRAEWE